MLNLATGGFDFVPSGTSGINMGRDRGGSLLPIDCPCSELVNEVFPHTGIDSEGHAANFVETEQIVHYKGSKASFVQVRNCSPA